MESSFLAKAAWVRNLPLATGLVASFHIVRYSLGSFWLVGLVWERGLADWAFLGQLVLRNFDIEPSRIQDRHEQLVGSGTTCSC